MSDSLTPFLSPSLPLANGGAAAFYRRGTRCFGQREDAADNEGLLLPLLLLLNG